VTEGAELLDALSAFVRRYVVMSTAQPTAVTLWVIHTHAFEAFEQSPYLAITSPEKRSGKSRLFDVLELLVRAPWRVISPTEAVLFRKVAAQKPTLLLDEGDAIFGAKPAPNAEGLRALLNAGNRRGTVVPRCVGPMQTLTDFPVYCPKALAAIRALPDTVADRSISIRLERKRRDEHVERFRRRDAEEVAEPLFEWARSWAEHRVPALAEVRPELPAELDDRQADAWEPLLALADAAGDTWPDRARVAAIELSGERDDDSAGVLLLRDLRDILDRLKVDRIATSALIDELCTIETSPWSEWYGRPISAHGVAKLLGHYGVRPRTVRFGEATAKGYLREQLEDAFSRYLAERNRHNGTSRIGSGTKPDSETSHVTDENAPDSAWTEASDGVTTKTPLLGDEDYFDYVDDALLGGVVTARERGELRILGRLLWRASRPAAGEEAVLAEVEALKEEGVLAEEEL
jgi:hypothetical protein